jgi:hypothetical protein
MSLSTLELEAAFRRCLARHEPQASASPVQPSNPGRFGDYEDDDYGDWDDAPALATTTPA